MNKVKCGNCVKFKTQYCPCTIDCMATDDYPYFQDKRMMLEENQQLKEQLQDLTRENFKLKDNLEKQRKEYQETYKDVREEIKDYKKQLQQRDEVIEECIESIQNFMTHIDDGFCADMMTFWIVNTFLDNIYKDNCNL